MSPLLSFTGLVLESSTPKITRIRVENSEIDILEPVYEGTGPRIEEIPKDN